MPGAGEFFGVGVVRVGEQVGDGAGRFTEGASLEGGDELLLEGSDSFRGEVPLKFHNALVYSPAVSDDDDEDPSVCHLHDFHVVDAGAVQGGVLDDGDLLGELTEETDPAVQDIVDADGFVEETTDRGAFGARKNPLTATRLVGLVVIFLGVLAVRLL